MKATKVPSSYDITSAIDEYQGMISHNAARISDHYHQMSGALESGEVAQIDIAADLVMAIEQRVNRIKHYALMIETLRKDLA
jgi:hypothetical protein